MALPGKSYALDARIGNISWFGNSSPERSPGRRDRSLTTAEKQGCVLVL